MSKKNICRFCSYPFQDSQLESNSYICPNCGKYNFYPSTERIQALADPGSIRELCFDVSHWNTIQDAKYQDAIRANQEKSGLSEAVICAEIKMHGLPLLIGVMDSRFMMASMGYVVGERICRLFGYGIKKRLPVVIFCCSGGARMQEGIVSLMQMEKTAALVKKHSDAGLLYVSVLTNPTMGGVSASFASLADVILAEKNATIGFAGARVIEQNTGEVLPDGFQSAEFQKEHGFVDAVVSRESIRDTLSFLLKIHQRKPSLRSFTASASGNVPPQINFGSVRTPWEQVAIARSRTRPTSLDYIGRLFPDFYELCGDRVDGDDHAVVAGVATFYGVPVTVIGHQKGKKDINDACYRNFGMPSPCGYRKALRLAKQADKYGRPIVFFVDTIGAACGSEAESKGQGAAIAAMLYEMSSIRVPVYSIIIGEGGSGGALAFAVGNEVNMLENAVYSVITPEGYASIVWKDKSKTEEAAVNLKLTSAELWNQRIVDHVIPEQVSVTTENMEPVCSAIARSLHEFLTKYWKKGNASAKRFKRFAKF